MLNAKYIIDYIESIKSNPEAGIYDHGRNQMADRIIEFIKTQENIRTVGQLIKTLEIFPEDMRIATEGLPYYPVELQIKHDASQDFDYVCIN